MVYSFQAQSSPEIDNKVAIKMTQDILISSKTTKFVQFLFLHGISIRRAWELNIGTQHGQTAGEMLGDQADQMCRLAS